MFTTVQRPRKELHTTVYYDYTCGWSVDVYNLVNKDVVVQDLTEMSKSIKEADIVIPESITLIPEYAFFCARNITSVTVLGQVTSIGYDAFGICVSLTDFVFADNSKLLSIGASAFSSCEKLKNINIDWKFCV